MKKRYSRGKGATYTYNRRWRKLSDMAVKDYGDALLGTDYMTVEDRAALREPLERAHIQVPDSFYGTGYVNRNDRDYVLRQLNRIRVEKVHLGDYAWAAIHNTIDKCITEGVEGGTPKAESDRQYLGFLFGGMALEALNAAVDSAGGVERLKVGLSYVDSELLIDALQAAVSYQSYDMEQSSLLAFTEILTEAVEYARGEENVEDVFSVYNTTEDYMYSQAKKRQNIKKTQEDMDEIDTDIDDDTGPAIQDEETITSATTKKDATSASEDYHYDGREETTKIPKETERYIDIGKQIGLVTDANLTSIVGSKKKQEKLKSRIDTYKRIARRVGSVEELDKLYNTGTYSISDKVYKRVRKMLELNL